MFTARSKYFWTAALTVFWLSSAGAVSNTIEVQSLEYLQADHNENEEPAWASKVKEVAYPSNEIKSTNAKGIIGWTPKGGINHSTTDRCHPHHLEKQMLNGEQNFRQKVALLNKYFEECESQLRRGSGSTISVMLKLATIKYDIYSNKSVRKIRLQLNNGNYLQGFIAIKPDATPRPMVIIKCGLFCDGGSGSSTRMMLSHLFDEGPFNLLVIGNQTGPRHLRANKRVVFGGFYEGQEMMAVGEWVKYYSPFRQKISELHAMGISLGSNAALYTSVFNDHNPISDHKKLFNSVVAYCPVVNLEDSLNDLYGDKLKGPIAALATWSIMKGLFGVIPDLTEVINPDKKPKGKQYPTLLARLATKFLSRIDKNEFLYPFKSNPVDHSSDFWAVNQFRPLAQNIQTPTLVWGAKDDWVVDNRINVQDLAARLGQQGKNKLGILNTKVGNHCASSVAHGWAAASTVLRSFFMSQSYKTPLQYSVKSSRIPFKAPQFDSSDHHISQNWQAKQGQPYLWLSFKTHSFFNDMDKCFKHEPLKDAPECYEQKTVRVSMKDLPMPVATPKTKTETEILTRWANSRLRIHGDSGRLVDSKEAPKKLKWVSYK